MRKILILFVSVLSNSIYAQNFTLPEKETNVKNGVKSVSVSVSSDREAKRLKSQIFFDRKGRKILDIGDGASNRTSYFYDETDRVVEVLVCTKSNTFLNRTTTAYNDLESTKTITEYNNSKDSLQPSLLKKLDSQDRTIGLKQFLSGREYWTLELRYAEGTTPIWQKDSSAQTLAVNIYHDENLFQRKIYSSKNQLLHTYTFTYSSPFSIKTISDTSNGKTDFYVIERKEEYGNVNAVTKNGITLNENELTDFIILFPMVQRGNLMADSEAPYDDNLKQHHELVRDEKGNITQDTLTMSQGSYKQILVFVYEYTYY